MINDSPKVFCQRYSAHLKTGVHSRTSKKGIFFCFYFKSIMVALYLY